MKGSNLGMSWRHLNLVQLLMKELRSGCSLHNRAHSLGYLLEEATFNFIFLGFSEALKSSICTLGLPPQIHATKNKSVIQCHSDLL